MIERQTINGREATVAYMLADFSPAEHDAFDLAKVLFDDGETIMLAGPGEGAGEESGFGRHRHKHRSPLIEPTLTEGELEEHGFSRHRMRHAAQFNVVLNVEPGEPDTTLDDSVDTTAVEPPVKLQLVAWSKALLVLDKSEILVRDMIERDLAGKTGAFADAFPMRTIGIANQLARKIRGVRDEAFKTAFRMLRSRLGNIPVLTVSLAAWAAYFAREDNRVITAAIQTALSEGIDSTEIARRVVGSMALNGVDGVTEYTRHKIAHLGRAAIKSSNLRKQGLDPDGEALRKLKGLDPGS